MAVSSRVPRVSVCRPKSRAQAALQANPVGGRSASGLVSSRAWGGERIGHRPPPGHSRRRLRVRVNNDDIYALVAFHKKCEEVVTLYDDASPRNPDTV